MKNIVLITAPPRTGKSTLIKKVIDEIGEENFCGFFTQEMRENGERVGFKVKEIGGDEFVLLVPNGSEETAVEFITKANTMCGSAQDDKANKPSVSWGYSIMTSIEQSYNELFAEADQMMYEYKKRRVEFSSSGTLPKES